MSNSMNVGLCSIFCMLYDELSVSYPNNFDIFYPYIQLYTIIGTIYKLRNIILKIPQHIDYVEYENLIRYNTFLYKEISKYENEEFSNTINSYFHNEGEEHSKETINTIIDLLILHTYIEFWEYFYTTHIYTVPIIKIYYNKFVNESETIYKKLLDNTIYNELIDEMVPDNKPKQKHSCINYRFSELKPLENHSCIICGKKYCEIIDVD